MKIVLLWVGKTKNSNLLSLLHRYEERIGHFCELLQKEVKAAEEVETDRVVAKEGERLLAYLISFHYLLHIGDCMVLVVDFGSFRWRGFVEC